MQREASSSVPLAAAYAALVIYATLYPFSGWHHPQGLWSFAFLSLPWPRWWDRFDVIANLVGNVRVHTSPDTALHLRLRSEDGWAILEVIDHGPGMDHETAARAFERFYRADSARTRATGGSGLGLSIVAAVVSAHRGHVRIVPTPGGGTTVQIALPLDPGPGGPASSPDSRQDG